jgi:hypothetical protein
MRLLPLEAAARSSQPSALRSTDVRFPMSGSGRWYVRRRIGGCRRARWIGGRSRVRFHSRGCVASGCLNETTRCVRAAAADTIGRGVTSFVRSISAVSGCPFDGPDAPTCARRRCRRRECTAGRTSGRNRCGHNLRVRTKGREYRREGLRPTRRARASVFDVRPSAEADQDNSGTCSAKLGCLPFFVGSTASRGGPCDESGCRSQKGRGAEEFTVSAAAGRMSGCVS